MNANISRRLIAPLLVLGFSTGAAFSAPFPSHVDSRVPDSDYVSHINLQTFNQNYIDTNYIDSSVAANIISNCITNRCYGNDVGDVDADGYTDAVVIEQDVGTMIVYGGPEGLPTAQSVLDIPETQRTRIIGIDGFGSGKPQWVIDAGDMTADGASELLIYAFRRRIYVLLGTPGFRAKEIDIEKLDGSNGFIWKTLNNVPGLVYTGDFNNDGLADLVEADREFNEIQYGNIVAVFGHQNMEGPASPRAVQHRTSPTKTDIFWSEPNNSENITGYIVTDNSGYYAQLDSNRRSIELDNVDGALINVQSINKNGLVSPAVFIQAHNLSNATISELRAEVYGPRLIELFLDTSKTYSTNRPYTVWRDGVVLGTGIGKSYIDATAKPNTTHQYVITEEREFRAGSSSNDFRFRSPVAVATTSLPANDIPAPLNPPRPPIPYSADSPFPIIDTEIKDENEDMTTITGMKSFKDTLSVIDGVIHWQDDGWYQVQDATTYEHICGGGLSCKVPFAGRYIVINHTLNLRAIIDTGATSNKPSSFSNTLVVDGKHISWTLPGWYQVQREQTYEEICNGTASCTVPESGAYAVINHTTKQRTTVIVQ